MTASEWVKCRYCPARGHVEWQHMHHDLETHTCFHHAREYAIELTDADWVKVTEKDWWEEEPRTMGAL